jgi:hypothetical protein
MGIMDESHLDDEIKTFRGKPAEDREAIMYRSILKIEKYGCSQRCGDKKSKVHPAISSSFVATVIIGVIEGLKHFTTNK